MKCVSLFAYAYAANFTQNIPANNPKVSPTSNSKLEQIELSTLNIRRTLITYLITM